MARRFAALFGTLVFALAFAMPALAASLPAAAPAVLPTADQPHGYYIVHDDAGVHLITHGPGHQHDFVAELHTDGIFESVSAIRFENHDHYAVLDGGHPESNPFTLHLDN